MLKSEFESMGFEIEVLPSGNLNIINSTPFTYNGIKTLCCYRGGKYIITTSHKSIKDLLTSDIKLITPSPNVKSKRSKCLTKSKV